MKKLLIATVFAAMAGAAGAGELNTNGCHAAWTDATLTVGNALFTRSYVAKGGVLRTVSWARTDGAAWYGAPGQTNGTEKISVAATGAKWSPVGVDGLRVLVEIGGQTTRLDLYPDMPGVIASRPKGDAAFVWAREATRTHESFCLEGKRLRAAAEANDALSIFHRHLKTTSFECRDQTDHRDRLVVADERQLMSYDQQFSVATTCLDVQDQINGEGLAFVRLAPMPTSRPGQVDDFIVEADAPQRLTPLANGYPLAELVYAGGAAGRRRALTAFQRALRPFRPGRDGVLLSNTWGAGNRDSRICQDFLLKEIEAGARIGVDVIQIDDGWQRGRSANSQKKVAAGQKKVWTGYWAASPDFWKEDLERFPDGLGFLAKKAAEKGMRFGLWFGPDSSDDAANWERDADCLIDYHRRLGIDYFKVDSMKLFTPLALERNRKMFDKMLAASNGEMVFDLDCTAEVRPGYFGVPDIGPLFVENRSSRRMAYWPHCTLKNLWDLAQVVDPVRLRMEFNNPDTERARYAWSPLGHPRYRPDALFATVMAASPLAWMELSDVSEASVAALAPLVKTWKAERARWYGGVIHPVAEHPDGFAWTGFVSEAADGKGGYALLFRELNESASYSLDLAPIFGRGAAFKSAQVIGGRGTASFDGSRLAVTIPEKLDFVWVKF